MGSRLISDVEFTALNPSKWLNPDNWCATATEQADCQPASPVDTENVPCVHDDSVFLRHQSYYVDLGTNLQFSMKTLKIAGTVGESLHIYTEQSPISEQAVSSEKGAE